MNMLSTSQTHSSATAMLAKSAVCVALVAGIAWIGVMSAGGVAATDPSVNEAGATGGIVIRGDRAAAHRQQVFEERRARFEARTPAQVAGSTHLEYPAP
ncbi:MAG: hypothetical protein U1F54_04370 [Burkholderiales bacterium]